MGVRSQRATTLPVWDLSWDYTASGGTIHRAGRRIPLHLAEAAVRLPLSDAWSRTANSAVRDHNGDLTVVIADIRGSGHD